VDNYLNFSCREATLYMYCEMGAGLRDMKRLQDSSVIVTCSRFLRSESYSVCFYV